MSGYESAASAFVGSGETEHSRFVEVLGENLHPHRKSFGRVATWNAHTGNSRQIAGDGVDIGQIHRHRVIDLLPELECGKRRNRGDDAVDLLKRTRKILRDQGANSLRLQVVRIVVAVAQHVGAKHDSALALRTEPLAAR